MCEVELMPGRSAPSGLSAVFSMYGTTEEIRTAAEVRPGYLVWKRATSPPPIEKPTSATGSLIVASATLSARAAAATSARSIRATPCPSSKRR